MVLHIYCMTSVIPPLFCIWIFSSSKRRLSGQKEPWLLMLAMHWKLPWSRWMGSLQVSSGVPRTDVPSPMSQTLVPFVGIEKSPSLDWYLSSLHVHAPPPHHWWDSLEVCVGLCGCTSAYAELCFSFDPDCEAVWVQWDWFCCKIFRAHRGLLLWNWSLKLSWLCSLISICSFSSLSFSVSRQQAVLIHTMIMAFFLSYHFF